ncbi:MAG: Signal peptidase I W [Candidatus Izimaplasma bacterium HR2]|nr:MAG: Signal peptidase I W [Candidatus Izimaplasma bacterium HR2]
MEKIIKKSNLLKNIRTGLFFVVSAILILYIAISIFMPENTVKIFGFKPYVVITDSMEPHINVHDLIIVKNPKADELVVEDIITFYADINYDGEKEIVTHYIYSINNNTDGDLLFKTHPYYEDDEEVFADNWTLGEDDVLGQHVITVPYVGAVVQFVKSPFGIAAMFVNLGVIAGIVYIMKKTDK